MNITLVKVISIIVLSACALLIVGAIHIVNGLIKPSPRTFTAHPTAEAVQFNSKTGNGLSGWYFEGDSTKGGALLMHGVRGNRLEMLDRAYFLNEAGYSVLIFDFQAHGASEGEEITFGYLESMDAEAAFEYLNNRLTVKSIGVIGMSLGGASALLGETAERADAVIIEAVYPTLADAAKDRLEMRLGKAGRLFSPLITGQMKLRIDVSSNFLRPIDKLEALSTPIMIIAGENDRRTHITESKKMFEIASEPKEFWPIAGAAHENYHAFIGEEYEHRVMEFFEKNLLKE